MYRINPKAIFFAFVLQMLVGGLWYASTPSSLLGRLPLEEGGGLPSISVILAFTFSVLACLLFTAWLLVKAKGLSGFGRFLLVIGIWVFIVFPNAIFVSVQLDLSDMDVLYLMFFGLLNCLIAAIILPLWQSSRSIFRG